MEFSHHTGTERSFACLAVEALDGLTFAMGAIADQGMNVGIGDSIIGTGTSGTGEPVRQDALGGTAPACAHTLRLDSWGCWGSRRGSPPGGRPGNRRACAV